MKRRSTLEILFALSLVATLGYAIDRPESNRNATNGETVPVADRKTELDGIDGRRQRLREGMKLVNRIGELHGVGGRVVFKLDGEPHSLQLLENLALERVIGDLDQTNRKWSISGVVTEYKGGNYLLLQRAVLKARVSHPSSPRS